MSAASDTPRIDHVFERLGEADWAATSLATGPFGGVQGGIVAALMADAVNAKYGGFIASLTTHFLKPVPLERLRVAIDPVRQGRRVSVLDGSLRTMSGDRVAIQRATLIRPQPDQDLPTPNASPSDPEALPLARRRPRPHRWLMDALDVRQDSTGVFWFREKVALFDGAGLTTLLLTVADLAHGLAPPLGSKDRPEVALPNPDVTVQLFREPVGRWVGVAPATAWSRRAIGVGWGALYDVQGLVGRVGMSVAITLLTKGTA